MTLDELFVAPDLVWVALLAPLAVWWSLRAGDRAAARRLADFVGPRVDVVAAELATRRRARRRTAFCIGLALALLALAQPTWGVDERKAEQRGVDVLVCLDVSRSMLAQDLAPSRLDRAKAELRALAERTRGDRLGLVVFAGDARLAVPFTQDTDSFADLVDAADPLSVGRGGTDLGAALDAALAAFGDVGDVPGVVLLITDGEDHGARGLRAAEACRERGVVVHTLGFGTEVGSKITVADDGVEEFLRDRQGDEVVSALDPSGLRAIADATGGAFVDARAAARPVLGLYDARIVPLVGRAFESERRDARMNRFQWPLGLALLVLLVEFARSDRRRG